MFLSLLRFCFSCTYLNSLKFTLNGRRVFFKILISTNTVVGAERWLQIFLILGRYPVKSVYLWLIVMTTSFNVLVFFSIPMEYFTGIMWCENISCFNFSISTTQKNVYSKKITLKYLPVVGTLTGNFLIYISNDCILWWYYLITFYKKLF